MPKHYLTSMARKCDSIHRPEISLTSMSRKCDSMDNTTKVGRPARRYFRVPATRPCDRTTQTPRARRRKKRPPRIWRCMLVWRVCLLEVGDALGLPRHPADHNTKILEPQWLRNTTTQHNNDSRHPTTLPFLTTEGDRAKNEGP